METRIALNYMNDTTPHINTRMDESESNSLAPVKTLSSVQKQAMRCLCGDGSLTPVGSAASTAPYSETRVFTDPVTSYNKRIKLLTESGLVAGITPTSKRKRSNQQTLDFALSPQDGNDSHDGQEAAS